MGFVLRYFVVWVALVLNFSQAGHAAVVTATWNSATDVPVSGSSYTATGNTVDFTLNFAPPTGTNLTVVNNTGLPFISGRFDNLVQGQAVTLVHNGVGYNFVANYHGGTGNDLVLVWAKSRAYAWGLNTSGQLGDGTTTSRPVAVPALGAGVLAGRTILALSAGFDHSLALCSDGTVAAWGANASGQLGDGTTTNRAAPGAVNAVSGVSALYGKTVVAVSAGYLSSMVLCSDGTVVTWGQNTNGMIGDNTLTQRSLPVAVNTDSGVSALHGKTVVAIAAGAQHNLALCSDGTVAAWGLGAVGQLGNNSTATSMVPVAVNAASGVSALHGKEVVAIASGSHHCLALCSDGSLASWGLNHTGMLGDNSTTNRLVPVAVNAVSGTSAFHGKTATAIAVAGGHNLVLCADGALVAWGENAKGPLGDGGNVYRQVPVAVNAVSGVSALHGRTVVEISCGVEHCAVRCADGAIVSWGSNLNGQLGNNNATGSRNVPTLTNPSTLAAGESLSRLQGGVQASHGMALVAGPTTAPALTSLAASDISMAGVTLNGLVNADHSALAVSFDYGPTTAYGTNVPATPAALASGSATAVSTVLNGLASGTLYHFRVKGVNSVGAFYGNDLTFTAPSNVVDLAGLAVSGGALSPAFSSGTTSYAVSVPDSTDSITLTPTLVDTLNTVRVNGVVVASGSASGPLSLSYGDNVINTVVTAVDGVTTKTYQVVVARAYPTGPEYVMAAFASGADVPVSAGGFTATGKTVFLVLNHAPLPGTMLTVVNNTGLPFIDGQFSNLAQGQVVNLGYQGSTYRFVAHYYGGTGNDLVLVWAGSRLVAWGPNGDGQLGIGTITTSSKVPVEVMTAGTPLADRTVLALATGDDSSLALCSDGTLASWGSNYSSQLGNNSPYTFISSKPVAVTIAGTPLAGKVPVAIAVGGTHDLVLCSDGTLSSWGANYYGQLGNGSTSSTSGTNNVPGVVKTAGTPLAGKSVVAVRAGYEYSLALCSDGTLVTWGANFGGQLGNNTTTSSSEAVAVITAGTPLAGKTVVAVATGGAHNLVLCSDGTLVTWGENSSGQLGNNTTTSSSVPVAVTTAGTVLAGKTIVAVAAGTSHSVALCSDGTLAAWGRNAEGQLGNNSVTNSSVPVAVSMSGVLAGKTVAYLMAGASFSMVRCTDGSVAAWGFNGSGQLGNNSTTNSRIPVMVNTSSFASGERFMQVAAGPAASCTLGLVAVPVPAVTTLAASPVGNVTAVLNGTVNANGGTATVSFDYGLDAAYGTRVAGAPSTLTSGSAAAVGATLAGLTPNTTYHFRANVTSGGVTYNGNDLTFTTLNSNLSGLSVAPGVVTPAFSPTVYSYRAAVGSEVSSVVVTPIAADSQATVAVNGVSAAPSSPVSLVGGDNTITIVVTAADGISTFAYTLVVTRPLPASWTAAYSSADVVPVTLNGSSPIGGTVNFDLNFEPVPGTLLTVVNNTGAPLLNGRFDNLAQGQIVNLSYNGATYPFVVNYYGGTGNDLVLTWAGTRLVSWGRNYEGALGNGSNTDSSSPVAVTTAGTPLAGRLLLSVAAGNVHSLALFADGSLASWGYNSNGQLGINSSTFGSNVPVPVITAGTPLEGKMVVAIAAGGQQNLVLCSDGTLAGWGYDFSGYRLVPSAVTIAGSALAGKTVAAIAAGTAHNIVLCSDGTLAAWGSNAYGVLGNASTTGTSTPVAVTTAGTALAGKTVIAVAAGGSHNLVLCSDGTLATWGYNLYGQLGNNTTTGSGVPVSVTTAGTVLAGKTVVAVAAGESRCLALCSDGTLAAWGEGTGSKVPAAVGTSGVLAGKKIVGMTAAIGHTVVWCADGTVAAWGSNDYGQLGNGTTTSSIAPVAVSTSSLMPGERLMRVTSGELARHTLGLVASPAPELTTLSATSVGATTAVVHGTVGTSGVGTDVSFEYGPDLSYGTRVTGSPAVAMGASATSVSTTLTGLAANTTYHFRVVGTKGGMTYHGEDLTFTTLDANLATLGLSSGTFSPAFNPRVYSYLVDVTPEVTSLIMTPTTSDSEATATLNGAAIASGSASSSLPLSYGDNLVKIVVTEAGGTSTATYSFVVKRALPAAWTVTYASGAEIPALTSGITAPAGSVSFALNYAPQPGTTLMVMNNTGRGFINSRFSNLAHGQQVMLSHNGVSYPFVANYYGGTGNDLVLVWAYTRPVAWGWNAHGQLGNNTTTDTTGFVPVPTAGTSLAGRTVLSLATAGYHSLALCSDGSLHTWGAGAGAYPTTLVPVPVITTGSVLEGKTVVSIAGGNHRSYALCSDGTIAVWERVGSQPSALPTAGTVLAGKTVVALAASTYYRNLALCSDGSLVTFGDTADSVMAVPVAGTPLAGRSVVSIAAGSYHHMALCSDGTLAAWGDNGHGQLGAYAPGGSTNVPTAVNTAGTALEGRTVTAIAAASISSLALCSDGTLVAWGGVPTVVNPVGALAGKTVVGIACGGSDHLARCSDGSIVYWENEVTPVEVSTSALAAGERVMAFFTGSSAGHTLGLAASPPPAVTTLATELIGTTYAVLQGMVNANNTPFPAVVIFEYGLDTSYGRVAVATPAPVTGSSPVAVNASLSGLQSNTTYHYRVRVVGGSADILGADQTFTTQNGNLSGLVLGSGAGVGALTPAFSPTVYNYRVDVGADVTSVVLTPTVAHSQATVAINGVAVASGSPSAPVPLPLPGENTVNVVVTASNLLSTLTYTVVVTRPVPSEWTASFASATDVALTTGAYSATGSTVGLSLNYAPTPGTSLTVVKNTGLDFINGQFSNLAHGQRVELVYNGVTYAFVANYHGGTGNDLVLAWAGTRTSGWGNSSSGQLTYNSRNLLAGSPFATRTPLAVAAGGGHSLVVFADGSVAGWGANASGQLGRGTTNSSYDPAAVSTAGTALAGKVVVSVAAGSYHSLALCSDGTLAAWGDNFYGQLGNGTTTASSVPVAVTTTGTPLEGKFVVAISAGNSHNLALCSDGTLAAWGSNEVARLGNWNVGSVSVRPVAVMTEDTALEGRTVVAIAAGTHHNLVLCSDGTLATWGFNYQGRLGMGAISTSSVFQAVAVTTVGTVLEGKTVTAIAAGGGHSLVLCSDGTLASWGSGAAGVLGNSTLTDSGLPVAVDRTGVLAGRTVVGITAGASHSTAWCADGTAAAWGSNFNGGQLGNPDAGNASSVPVRVTAPAFWVEEGVKIIASSPAALHTLALVATVPPDGSPPSSNATLSSLNTNVGALDPVFHGDNPYYSIILDAGTAPSITFTPTVSEKHAGVAVGTQILASGTPSNAIPLTPGLGGNLVNITTIAPDGVTWKIYQVWVLVLTPAEKWRWHMNGWRNEHGFFINSGNMADTGDYDNDGISNLMEYALRLNPKQAGSLPAASALNGANFEYTYTRSTAAANTGTVFTVQWASSLAAPAWSSNGVTETVLSDDGTTQQVKAVIPKGAAAAMYVRLAVGGPPP